MSMLHFRISSLPSRAKTTSQATGGRDLTSKASGTGEDVKKSLRLLREVRLPPREVKPSGFVFFCRQGKKNGGKDQVRTGDTRIFSPMLYQLSYPATSSFIFDDVRNIHPFPALSSRNRKKFSFFSKRYLLFSAFRIKLSHYRFVFIKKGKDSK